MNKKTQNSKRHYEGKSFPSNHGAVTVCEYTNANNITVKFKNTGTILKTTTSNLVKGKLSDFMAKTVHGVGFIGSEIKLSENCKTIKSYSDWASMISRCYSEKYKLKYPTYEKTKICDKWFNYTDFKKWHDIEYIHGFCIDKDLLSIPENKIYSPETCCFIPECINNAIQSIHRKKSKLKTGVTLIYKSKYASNIGINGYVKYLGTFDSEDEAHNAWITAKKNHIANLANRFKSKLKNNIYEALMQFESTEQRT